MNVTEVSLSFVLSLLTNVIVMVGATSFFYWVNTSTAAPFVVRHRKGLELITGLGFMAYLLAQMVTSVVFDDLQSSMSWSYLNMLILTMFILNMQLKLRWQAILDIVVIAACYLVFGTTITPIGVGALVVAAISLYLTQEYATDLVAHRLWKYGLLALFSAAILTMTAQIQPSGTDMWFWVRQLVALIVMALLCLEYEQIMRLTMHRTNHIHQLTSVDELTGVHNFATFNQELVQRFNEFQKSGKVYSVFEGDLDHFKQINDTYGHLSGNVVLQRLAGDLEDFAESLPFPATAYRLGGEEFAIIAQAELTYAQAMKIGEDFQEQLQFLHFPEVDPDLTITCSIGQAHVQAADYSADDVYKHADRKLYEAKRSGRNRVSAQEDHTEAI